MQRGEQDFRFLSDVVQAVQDLEVPNLVVRRQNPTATCDKLPEVVQPTHSESITPELDPLPEEVQESTANTIQEDIDQQSAIQSTPEPEPKPASWDYSDIRLARDFMLS